MKRIYRMKLQPVILMLLAVWMLPSCNDDSDMDQAGEGETAVQFASGSIAMPQTRTTVAGDQWTAGDRIGIYMIPSGSGIAAATAANIAYRAANSAVASPFSPVNTAETIYYPKTGTSDFISYYPWKATGTGAGEIDNHLYPVHTADQSDPAAIDLLYSDNATNKARSKTDPVELQFNHMLSKITINVLKGNGMDGVDFSGMTVSISGLHTETTFNLETASFGTPENAVDMVAHTTADGAKYDAIIIPQTSAAASKATFTTGGVSYVWNMGTHAFGGGKEYIFDITVNESSITATGEIIPWTTGAPVAGDAKKVYTITYNANGGTGSQSGQYAISGTPTPLSDGAGLTAPASKTFIGWSTTANYAGDYYTPGSSFATTQNVTLYAVWSGDGSAGNPILVFDAAGMNNVRNGLDKEYMLKKDISLSGWVPIGTFENQFTGIFNGGGHSVTITGFGTIPISDRVNILAGLFGCLGNGSQVRRLCVAGNISVTGEFPRLGGIAGYNDGGTISNCVVTANISGTGSSIGVSHSIAGGIVGRNLQGTIMNCYTTGTVAAISKGMAPSSFSDAGGIVGYGTGTGHFWNCVALNGSVTAQGGTIDNNRNRISHYEGTAKCDFQNNYGSSTMTGGTWVDDIGEKDGADCDAKPADTWWKNAANWKTDEGASAWDFTNIWEMGADGYPKLRVVE